MTAYTGVPVLEEQSLCASPLKGLDSVELVRDRNRATVRATLGVDCEDPHLSGHFPGLTILPGVFLIELLCKAVAFAVPDSATARLQIREVCSVRFLAPILGGDTAALQAEITPAGANFEVEAVCRRRDGVLAAKLRVLFGYDA